VPDPDLAHPLRELGVRDPRAAVPDVASGAPGYTTIYAAIDFILNGVVVKTVNVSCEGSTFQ